MPATVRRNWTDGAVSLSSIGLVVAGMALIDENVRRYLVSFAHGDFQIAGSMPDVSVHRMIGSVTDLIGRDHMELAAYGFAGAVLFVMMFKT